MKQSRPKSKNTDPVIKSSFLNAVRLERDRIEIFDEYPFCVPAVRHLDRLEFHPAVTFFVGENGSGKSTLLEALAVKLGFNAEGGSKNFNFSTRETHSRLHEFIRIERGIGHPTDNYFLRAESFYNLATQIEDLGAEFSYRRKGNRTGRLAYCRKSSPALNFHHEHSSGNRNSDKEAEAAGDP